jgi:hypothetical protein
MTERQQEVIEAAEAVRELRALHPEEFGSFANDIHALDMLDAALAEFGGRISTEEEAKR